MLDEDTYDLVYSASAFHWIPPEVGLVKVQKLLISGGAFAWFSNQPSPAEEHLHIYEDLQTVYREHADFFRGNILGAGPQFWRGKAEKKKLEWSGMLRQYGFNNVTDRLYYSSRTFSAEDYIALLNTYSDHKAMPHSIRQPFLNRIAGTIYKHGGKFTLADTIILSMGRKK